MMHKILLILLSNENIFILFLNNKIIEFTLYITTKILQYMNEWIHILKGGQHAGMDLGGGSVLGGYIHS
jgi:hypothetical protein